MDGELTAAATDDTNADAKEETFLTGEEAPEGESEAPGQTTGEDGTNGTDETDGTGAKEKNATGAAEDDAPPEGDYDLGIPQEQLDAEMFQEFSAAARKMGLSNAKARELVALNQKSLEKFAEARMEAWHQQQQDWIRELRADKEFGGGHFAKTREDANRALKRYGDQALIKELRENGLGNHAGLIRLLARIGREGREDRAPEGRDAPAREEKVSNWYD